MTESSHRLSLLADRDPRSAAVVTHLIDIAKQALPQMYVNGEFVFTLRGSQLRDGTWQLHPAGTSLRYGAITALGLLRYPETVQRSVLGRETVQDLIMRLAKRLHETSDSGDTALVCWAAAEAKHEALTLAIARLAELQKRNTTSLVVETAWEVSALVAARPHADVEEPLTHARARLLAARSRRLYPHATKGGANWIRAHVGSFAAQVYPIQALARLHQSADDQQALATANSVAESICGLQGANGQWWWHYDARTGGLIEGYPVYTVHQHAMGPMALLDLVEAGGDNHFDSICRGLRWLGSPAESTEPLILDEPPITWRKVARKDSRKLARSMKAASTRIVPGMNMSALDRIFPPGVLDYECRPYEFGWLLMTWA